MEELKRYLFRIEKFTNMFMESVVQVPILRQKKNQ